MMVSSQPGGVGSTLPRPVRRSSLPLVAVGIVLLLLVVGAAGYAVIHFMGNSANNNPGRTDPANGTTGTSSADLAGGHEIGRYWLEVDTPKKDDTVRAGDAVTMQSGQRFRLHFSPNENGYIYVIGPSKTNTRAVYLTAQPSAEAGLKTNEVKSGLDFAFPGITSKFWITLVDSPGTEEFTFVFSAKPITNPPFFAGPSEHELTADEEKQLDEFRTQFKANVGAAEVIKNGAFPSVSVKVPQSAAEGTPVFFKVRVDHK